MQNPSPPSAFTVQLPVPTTKFERDREAFYRLLPDLLRTYQGRYVAIHQEQVVDDGLDRLEVAMRVLQRIGNVDIFVGRVSELPETVGRSGVIRVLQGRGDRS